MTTTAAARRIPLSLARNGLTVAIVGGCIWLLCNRFSSIDPAHLARALAQVGPLQWLGALATVVVSFLAVAGQERALLRHFGLRVPFLSAARAGMAAAAVGQTVGFGPLTGALVRRRLLPGLTIPQALGLSTAMTVGFAVVIAVMTSAATLLSPELPHQTAAAVVLAIAALALGVIVWQPSLAGRRLPLPNLFTTLSFLGWLALDLASLCLTLWILFPAESAPDLFRLLPAFLLALGAGLASGAPAGIGVFEVTLLAQLPGVDEANLIAAVVSHRVMAYALPMLVGSIVALAGPGDLPGVLAPDETTDIPVAVSHRAEARLAGQGGLALIPAGLRQAWLSVGLPHCRVALRDPFPGRRLPDMTRALLGLRARARDESRIPVLYKAEARMAATARRQGFRTIRIAEEAWLVPARFSDTGPHLSGLRRKLRHAAKSGITCAPGTAWLPLADMAEISRQWVEAHGGERGLSVSRFDIARLAEQRCFLARDQQGKLVAFVTFHVVAGEWSLDLVRFGAGLPDGTMHALIRCAIASAAAERVPRLSLAAVPEPGFGLTGWPGRIALRLTERSRGLAQFKRSFAPHWSPLYLAAPGRPALAIAALELARAIHRRD